MWVVPLRPTVGRILLKVALSIITMSEDGPPFRRSGKYRLRERRLARVIVVVKGFSLMLMLAPSARTLLSSHVPGRVLHRRLCGDAKLHHCSWLRLLQVLDFRPQLCVFCQSLLMIDANPLQLLDFCPQLSNFRRQSLFTIDAIDAILLQFLNFCSPPTQYRT